MSQLTPDDSTPLGLMALDAEDLAVISAHVQDAVLRPADIVWRPGDGLLVLTLRRFDWSSPARRPQRRLSALHFGRVARVVHKGMEPSAGALNLLAISFEPGEAPSGALRLDFSGGGAIRAEVECIEAQLKDLGPVWEAIRRPAHETDGEH
ncbi:hypothetical protein GCM10019059_29800 [Camelimonas fluminis]|uniref:DUF2948 family protein n=1 Tax=Camelimonas fluminis TaxID=1576911 RepID=A0ABV7UI54_9HYPH|nr:DUF2948 family protein [Camelimonas fluminis]GHE67994.1 hypothetical protein GCM10019059_29800 [Camelimonas fluminis]